MNQKTKVLLLLLVLCVSFMVVFDDLLISAVIEHECIGVNCPICIKITVLKSLQKTIKVASVSFTLAALLIYFSNNKSKYFEFSFIKFTPIPLKVRINA